MPILAFFISMNATFAYFTSSVELDKSTSQTGVIKIAITDDTAWKVNSASISASTKLIPGDTLSVEGKVENAGNAQFYAILQLKINVKKVGEAVATTIGNKYYTYSGTTLKEIVVKGDGSVTSTAFIVDAPNANKTNTYTKAFSIPYTFDFYEFDNSYKNATVTYSVHAHAIQTKNLTDTTAVTKVLIGKILPLEYQQIEYIESSGTQWIDTGFTPNQDTRVVMDFQVAKLGANFIFGSRQQVGSNSYTFNLGGSDVAPYFVTSYASENVYTIRVADIERHVVDKNKNEVYLDNVLVKSFVYQNFSCPAPLELLASYSGNKTPAEGYLPSSTRIYSCQMYDNGTLIRDFVPCVRTSDNVAGLFDRVNNEFYTNSGTGTFKTIPAEYQQVEYIQGTGTQWIDTGVLASENNSFEVKAQLLHTNENSQTIWGGRRSSSNPIQGNQLSCVKSTGTYQFCCGDNVGLSKDWDTNLHTFYANKNKLYIDGNLEYTVTSNVITEENSVCLFATNTGGTVWFAGGSLKMFYCKIWNNETLIRDFVPCYRKSDNVVGLYDRVNNVFYANAGTGEFLKGANV